ncbi:hypothetical protein WR25_25697 [Diploscapter pachys]|uniref:Uncharacterized protein n=1 Tax=Diploscapter pachys TaxID=2018661 RepID=A0A2A2K6E1_9BILA|nr:hypothetical protein WR25_25697 [Diploscapter pachys]
MTGVLRRYALEKSIMDIPNARSSHSVPTPRGGGVAIVLAFLVSLLSLAIAGFADTATLLACAGAGGLIAIVGFMDDHGHIAARWRLLSHFAAAAWSLICLGGMAPLQFWGMQVDLGWLGALLAAVYLAAWASPVLFWGWLILLGTFIVDATFTLLRRLARGDKVYEAHRSHAYQFASRRNGRHLPVTLAVAALNVFWLLPVALSVVAGLVDGVVGLLIGYAPLLVLAVRYRAGALERNGA